MCSSRYSFIDLSYTNPSNHPVIQICNIHLLIITIPDGDICLFIQQFIEPSRLMHWASHHSVQLFINHSFEPSAITSFIQLTVHPYFDSLIHPSIYSTTFRPNRHPPRSSHYVIQPGIYQFVHVSIHPLLFIPFIEPPIHFVIHPPS